ncbi:MAG TPA: hypothetical protein VGC88_02015 [Terriglobales bacterium]|jgi:hypothetical protein
MDFGTVFVIVAALAALAFGKCGAAATTGGARFEGEVTKMELQRGTSDQREYRLHRDSEG